MIKLKARVLTFMFCISLLTIEAKRTVITGTVKNSKVTTVKSSFRSSIISFKQTEKEFPIDKKGNFKISWELNELTKIYFTIDEQYTWLYLQSGDSMNVVIDYADFDNSLKYTGANANRSMFIKAYNSKFVFDHEQEVYQQLANRKAAAFSEYCDSLLIERTKFLEDFTIKNNLDPVFKAAFQNEMIFENATNKLSYPSLWAYFRKLRDTVPEMPYNYFNFIKKLNLNNEAFLTNDKFFEMVNGIMENGTSYFHVNFGISTSYQEKNVLAKMILKNQRVYGAYEAHLVLNALENDKFKNSEGIYLEYVKNNQDSPFITELNETYSRIKKISPGQPAPSFTLKDLSGKEHSLEEFKGKVVYLDFWASWCGPCLRELPFSKKLKSEYEQQNIVFLYISVDEDEKSWKAAIEKNGISGQHLIAPSFNNKVCELYNVLGVPTYFLIGKDGNILDNTPPRPSDETEIRKLISEALKN